MSWEKGNANAKVNNEHEKKKKKKVLWLLLMSSTWTAAQCSPVTLADIATATVWEAEWPSDNRQSLSPDCYSHRLSLLGCPPNLYQDLSWISPIANACLCAHPPTVCSTVCTPRPPPPTTNPFPFWQQTRTLAENSHHTDTHPAKSGRLCQKYVKSLPFTHHDYWQGRINWGQDSPYFSSS